MGVDRLILAFDRALKTIGSTGGSGRPSPGVGLPEPVDLVSQRQETAALMRVNHAGEVCAQALYEGQALFSRSDALRHWLNSAAEEEADHLHWTRQRVAELGGHLSLLNPAWYAGSFALGVAVGIFGDQWSLGFLRETERQVVAHLDRHLARLPESDQRSRAILEAMRGEELGHATAAAARGATEIPAPLRTAMVAASRVMTETAYRL
jgi:ubiquinone biosynthesis monooxygenase Coq7